MDKIDVLDHGFVRLVNSFGSDLSIAHAARVSDESARRADDKDGSDARLFHYLWRNGCIKPFETVVFEFEVKAPLFILWRWRCDQAWSLNEVHAPETQVRLEFYLPESARITRQSESKQNMHKDVARSDGEQIRTMMKNFYEEAFENYISLLRRDVPSELARSVLPLGTYSQMILKANLPDLFSLFDQRVRQRAPYELRVYTDAMRELIQPIVPVALSTWEENRSSQGS